VVLLSLIVVFAVLLWPGPTAEEQDTATFGVPVDRHVTRVTARFLDHSPSLADAAVPGATAVPVERYGLDGQLLTFVVLHNATSRLRRSALDVALPAGLRASRVRDVGAGGPALRREP
jgi:hypothetical protein